MFCDGTVVKFAGGSTRQLWKPRLPFTATWRPSFLCTRRISTLQVLDPTIYEPLDHSKSEIRIIQLEPGGQNDAISCQLQTHSLNYRPRYDTLSYTWGNPKPTRSIRVNGKTVSIAENLFIALRSLRHRRDVVMIWADALCIDQNNAYEKNFQVAMMGRIYSQGRQTWISLGSPDKVWANGNWSPGLKLQEKMKFIKYLVRGTWRLFWHHFILRRSRLSRLSVNHISDTVRLTKILARKKQLSNEDTENQSIAYSKLSWLISHPYWTRLWIAQEICLSRHDPICMFGKWRIPLMHLDTILSDWRGGWDGIDCISSHANAVGTPSRELASAANRTTEICMLRDEFRRTRLFQEPEWLDLIRCLQLASLRHASLAHDHVYGLRSLLSPESRKRLCVDYNISLRGLYADVTRSVLQQERSIDVLCAAAGISTRSHSDLPSWALDVSAPLMLPADRATDAKFELKDSKSGNGEILSLLGTSFNDKVIAIQDPLSEQWPNMHKFRVDDDLLKGAKLANSHIIQCLNTAVIAGLRPNPKVFLQIMVSPVYAPAMDSRLNDQAFERKQEEIFRGKLNELLQGQTATENDTDSEGLLDSTELSWYAFPVLSSFAKQQMGLPGRNDVFFCTEKGRVGKSPGNVQIGDELWKLSSCKIPFLLRQSDHNATTDTSLSKHSQYRLVGPCLCSDATRNLRDGEVREDQQIELV